MKSINVEFMLPEGFADFPRGDISQLVFETLGYAFLYYLFIRLVQFGANKLNFFRPQNDENGSRGGSLFNSLPDEILYSYVLAFHHFFSAGLMFYGYRLSRPDIWRSGIAVEMGFEIVDTLKIILNTWPYDRLKYKTAKFVPLAHHLPTLILIPFLVRLGYDHFADFQRLGWALIGAGGFGFFAEGSGKLLNNIPVLRLLKIPIYAANLAVMLYARAYIYPTSVLSVLQFMRKDPRADPIYPLSVLGAVCIAGFNLFVVAMCFSRLVRSFFPLFAAAKQSAILMPQKLYDFPAGQQNDDKVKQS